MIGDLVQRIQATKPEPPPNDLLNAEYPCECGIDGCCSPLPRDPSRSKP